MGFFASLSQWFSRHGSGDDGAEAEPMVEAVAISRDDVVALANDGQTDIAVGVNCLLTVTDRHFVVEIVELNEETIRVSFPGIDYPIAGMLVDIEFHYLSGFSYYQTKVVEGPQREGDGIVLVRPAESTHIQHRDSCRVPTDLTGELKISGGDESFEAKLINLSSGGAMIETAGEFEVGAALELTLTLPDEPTHTFSTQVLHVGGVSGAPDHEIRRYGTRFTGHEPGAGRSMTRFIWGRLRELYPTV